MLAKPPAPNYVNYLSLPVMPGNGSYLAVNSKPGESNGGAILTVGPRPAPFPDNNNTATFIAMENLPHSHQYLIPKPEHVAMHNYSKNEPAIAMPTPVKRRSPAAARPTNHQRMKTDPDEDEGEEIRPSLDPSIPFLHQIVKIDHTYSLWLPVLSLQDNDDRESTISSDEKLDHNEEGEETETAAEGEDSVTRCIW